VKFLLHCGHTPNLPSEGSDHSLEDGAKVDRECSCGGIQSSATRLKLRQHEGMIKKLFPKDTSSYNLSPIRFYEISCVELALALSCIPRIIA
jgi:hypothetical protein